MLTSGSSVCRPSLLDFPLSLLFLLDFLPSLLGFQLSLRFPLDSPPFQLFLARWLPSPALSGTPPVL